MIMWTRLASALIATVPGAALANTHLIEDLNEDGRVAFSVQE